MLWHSFWGKPKGILCLSRISSISYNRLASLPDIPWKWFPTIIQWHFFHYFVFLLPMAEVMVERRQAWFGFSDHHKYFGGIFVYLEWYLRFSRILVSYLIFFIFYISGNIQGWHFNNPTSLPLPPPTHTLSIAGFQEIGVRQEGRQASLNLEKGASSWHKPGIESIPTPSLPPS